MKRLILVGDSIRMGYQDTVVRELDGMASLSYPEANGGNSGKVLENIEAWVLSQEPDILHLNCGLHDIKKDFGATDPAIDPHDYEANLRSIFETVLDAGIKLVWAATTPVIETRHHAVKGFDRFEADVDTYNAVATKVAADFSVPIDDLHKVVMDGGREELLRPDGVHFTPEGYELLGETVAAFLKPYLIE